MPEELPRSDTLPTEHAGFDVHTELSDTDSIGSLPTEGNLVGSENTHRNPALVAAADSTSVTSEIQDTDLSPEDKMRRMMEAYARANQEEHEKAAQAERDEAERKALRWSELHAHNPNLEEESQRRAELVQRRKYEIEEYDPRVSDVRIGGGKGVESTVISGSDRDAAIEKEKRRKLAAIELAPRSREEELGVNMVRVDSFLESKGLQAVPALLLSREDIDNYIGSLLEHGVLNFGLITTLSELSDPSFTDKDLEGIYVPDLGVSIVLIDAAVESHLDPAARAAYLEAIVIHEKAHATEDASDRERIGAAGSSSTEYARAGSRVGRLQNSGDKSVGLSFEGDFLEEAFAQMMAGEYVRDALGLPNGIWADDKPPLGQHPDIGGEHIWPLGKDGEQTIFFASWYAATGMELLVQKRPELYQSLIDARTSVEGRRKVAQLINSVEAGLYVKLRKLQYNMPDFQQGLALVQDACL